MTRGLLQIANILYFCGKERSQYEHGYRQMGQQQRSQASESVYPKIGPAGKRQSGYKR
jgi:hypothetical protein